MLIFLDGGSYMLIGNGVNVFIILIIFEKNMFINKGSFWWKILFISFKYSK